MAVRTKEEIIKTLSEYFGEDDSDRVISILEDVSDTLYSYGDEDREDWRKKYDELDKEWRRKYRDRFLRRDEYRNDYRDEYEDEYKSNETERFKEVDGEDVEYKEKVKTFDDLFEEEEEK